MLKIYILIWLFSGILISCEQKKRNAQNENWSHHDIKTQQYLIQGKKLYSLHCSSCHMDDGKGLARLIPPLAQSNYMKADLNRTICIIKYGISGEIIVNDEIYNHPMPGVENLTPLEIAEISTYIFNSWGHDKGMVTIPQVREALLDCKEIK